MKMKALFFLLPIIILLEIYLFSWIVELLRQPSDIAVILGFILVSIGLIINYFLFITIQKQIKSKK